MPEPKQSNIYADLIAAQRDFPPIIKDAQVNAGQRRYKYAELSDILDAVKPVLHANNFALVQATDVADTGDLTIVTRLYHISGDQIVGTYPVRCVDPNDPQKVGSALTYGRRYALMAMLGLGAEDDDGQAASRATTRPQTQQHDAPPTPIRQQTNEERLPMRAKEAATTGSMIESQQRAIFGLGKGAGFMPDDVKALAYERFHVDSMTKLTFDQAGELIEFLQGEKGKVDAAPLRRDSALPGMADAVAAGREAADRATR